MSTNQVSDVLTSGERLGAFLFTVGMLLLAGFFVLHQTGQTGFFNENFGTLEMLLLYGPIVLSILDFGIQVVTGRRDLARPFEVASSLLLGLAAIWFLIHFPFEFSHLGDVLPQGLRFLLGWVTNDIGKIPLVIQAISGAVTAFKLIRTLLGGPG